MKVKLRYTDCLNDEKNVFRVLIDNHIVILKTEHGVGLFPNVTIRIKNYDDLNKLLYELNSQCVYGVTPVKVIPDSKIASVIKKIFKKIRGEKR